MSNADRFCYKLTVCSAEYLQHPLESMSLITAGLYRLTKHPVYVSKLAGWLLIWIPFLAGGSILEDVRLTMLWGLVCVLYALRAVAEEKLLSNDPDYVTYALHMDSRGMFAWVGRLVPIMSFKYRLERWKKERAV